MTRPFEVEDPQETSKRPFVSIVCPVFNEEAVLPLFHGVLLRVIDSLADRFEFEIVYVDDGSRDRSLLILRELSTRDERVRYLALSRNFGHQAALTAGLRHARGIAVISLDTDLQHPPGLIPTLLRRWQDGFDVVLTIREDDPATSWFKRTTSRLFYQILRRWSDLDIRAAASDFRLLSRPALEGLLAMGESHRFLRGMVQWLGFPATEVRFQADPRAAGHSKYTLSKMVRLAFDGLLSFSSVPMRLGITGALSLLVLSFATCLVAGLHFHPDPFLVIALLGVHLVGGAVIAAIGLLGAYVRRIFEEVKQRPLYVVRESSEDEWPHGTHRLNSPRTRHPGETSAA